MSQVHVQLELEPWSLAPTPGLFLVSNNANCSPLTAGVPQNCLVSENPRKKLILFGLHSQGPVPFPPPGAKHCWLQRNRGGKYKGLPLSFSHLFMPSLTHTLTHLLNTHSPSTYVLQAPRRWHRASGSGGSTHLGAASSHRQICQPACSHGG